MAALPAAEADGFAAAVEARVLEGFEAATPEAGLATDRLRAWAAQAAALPWFPAFVASLEPGDLDALILAALEWELGAHDAVPVLADLEPVTGQKTLLTFPFQDEMTVVQGNRDPYSHIPGTSNEYAWDFMAADADGRLFTGNPMLNESYYSWEAPALAPADGVVVRLENKMPDHPPADLNPPGPNFVWIDHGNGEISRIYHLRQGSITVEVGQEVKRRDVIGLIGNSGNSLYPHIHYQLDRVGDGARETIPARFCGYRRSSGPGLGGELVVCGSPARGDYIRSALPAQEQ